MIKNNAQSVAIDAHELKRDRPSSFSLIFRTKPPGGIRSTDGFATMGPDVGQLSGGRSVSGSGGLATKLQDQA
jgi:hypothetical protein